MHRLLCCGHLWPDKIYSQWKAFPFSPHIKASATSAPFTFFPWGKCFLKDSFFQKNHFATLPFKMPSSCGAMFLVKQDVPTGTVSLYWENLVFCHYQQLSEKEPQSLSACGLSVIKCVPRSAIQFWLTLHISHINGNTKTGFPGLLL